MNLFHRTAQAMTWIIIRFIYRVRVKGGANIPESGPAVLVPNHVSYLDAVLIAAHCKRPIRFAMYWKLYNAMKWLVKPLGAFPIASPRESKEVYEKAFCIMGKTLDDGGLVCIFPEGMLTLDGGVNKFRPGVMTLLKDRPVPVIPIGLSNLWGSYFSKKKPGLFKLPVHFMAKVTMRVGKPIEPGVSLVEIRERVCELIAD